MDTFVYTSLPTRVVFGFGTIDQIRAETERLRVSRSLVLTTPEQTAQGHRVEDLLGARCAGVYSRAAMHTPVSVTKDALRVVKELNVDSLISIGGGSTTGLGKAISLRTDLPQICIPTTYAGSEMTSILGQTEGGVKTTLRDPKVLPEVVIYDVELTMTLPAGLSGTSGLNAMAHAVEALYSKNANPVLSIYAEQGIKALAESLPQIYKDPASRTARYHALYGAWLCGICLGSSDVALHHKLCHVLGGSFDLPHAETHTVILPHAIAYNAPGIPQSLAIIARALNTHDVPASIFDLAESIGARTALKDLGMSESGLDAAAEAALKNPYYNPVAITRAGIRELLANAFEGKRPSFHTNS